MAVLDHSDSNVDPQLVNVFFGLQLTAAIGLSLVLITALASSHVKRNATWYTFLVTWIVSCISYLLLFLLGQQSAPTYGPCLVQAGAIYAAPVLTGCSTLAFAVDMLLGVLAAASGQRPSKRRHYITLTLLVAPFVPWLAIFLGLVVFGIDSPSQVRKGPNGTYCDFESNTPSRLSSAVAIATTLVLVGIEGYIAARLIKNRNLLKDRQLATMAVRVIIFSLLGALGLGVGVAYVLYDIPGTSFDVIMALLPIGAVLIFGTQADLVGVWMFWRKRQVRQASESKIDVKSVPTPCFEP